MKQWCGKFPSSPVGLCCGVIASMCLKKGRKKKGRENETFKEPQSLKLLALLLSTESRGRIKLSFMVTQLDQSQGSVVMGPRGKLIVKVDFQEVDRNRITHPTLWRQFLRLRGS